MKISEACYEQLNNLIKKSFDCNAQADNFAYNIDTRAIRTSQIFIIMHLPTNSLSLRTS